MANFGFSGGGSDSGSKSGNAKLPVVETFTPTNEQTVFTLTTTPEFPALCVLTVDEIEYNLNQHFTIVNGNELTWLNVGFELKNYHRLKIRIL